MVPTLSLNIQCVAAWAPTIDTPQKWHDWATTTSHLPKRESEFPSISFVPASIRRRCSNLAKISLATAYACSQQSKTAARSVFASRHGESHITLRLLEALARNEQLSPTDFSLSIHNGVSGLFSIATRNTCPSIAIAGGACTLGSGLIETAMSLAGSDDNTPSILVLSEEILPKEFESSTTNSQSTTYSLCLLCTKNSDHPSLKIRLSLESTKVSTTEYEDIETFLRWLLSDQTSTKIQTSSGSILLEKISPTPICNFFIPLHGSV